MECSSSRSGPRGRVPKAVQTCQQVHGTASCKCQRSQVEVCLSVVLCAVCVTMTADERRYSMASCMATSLEDEFTFCA